LPIITEGIKTAILKNFAESESVSIETAQRVFDKIWLFAHGLATIIATGHCPFNDKEVKILLDEMYGSIIASLKLI
jgi:hypothetical protein